MAIGFRDGDGDIDETELCLVEELVKPVSKIAPMVV